MISILVDEAYQISSNGLISPLHNRQPASTNRHQKTYRLTKTTIPGSRSSDRSTNCCYQFSPSYFLCIDHPNAEIPRTHCATSKPITDLSSDCCTQENWLADAKPSVIEDYSRRLWEAAKRIRDRQPRPVLLLLGRLASLWARPGDSPRQIFRIFLYNTAR